MHFHFFIPFPFYYMFQEKVDVVEGKHRLIEFKQLPGYIRRSIEYVCTHFIYHLYKYSIRYLTRFVAI